MLYLISHPLTPLCWWQGVHWEHLFIGKEEEDGFGVSYVSSDGCDHTYRPMWAAHSSCTVFVSNCSGNGHLFMEHSIVNTTHSLQSQPSNDSDYTQNGQALA